MGFFFGFFSIKRSWDKMTHVEPVEQQKETGLYSNCRTVAILRTKTRVKYNTREFLFFFLPCGETMGKDTQHKTASFRDRLRTTNKLHHITLTSILRRKRVDDLLSRCKPM